VRRELVVPTGRIIARILFAEGGPAATANPQLEILAPEPRPDGTRKVVASSFTDGTAFDLSPGEYVLSAKADLAAGETPFRLEPGTLAEVSVVLDAGILAVSSEGGRQLDVTSSETDIYGAYPVLATRHADRATIALPAGEYRVVATPADGSQRAVPVVIEAGRRTAVSVP
jgi:Ca-activated chloride channel homolog